MSDTPNSLVYGPNSDSHREGARLSSDHHFSRDPPGSGGL